MAVTREPHPGYGDFRCDAASALLVDPLGFDAGDSNLYRYVNNAPTNATDPSGMAISEIPVSQIVLEYEKEFYQQKLASFTGIGNAAEKWATSVANWKIKDGVNALGELFKTGKKFIAESKTAAELAFMSGFASVTDSFVVLGSKQNPDDRTKVKDVLQPRLDPGQFGDITVPHLGTIFGLKLTPQLASVEYSKNGSVAWCRLNLEAKFTFGILKDHTLNISPTGTWYGVTAQQDFKRNDKHFLVFSNNPEVKDGPAAAVFNWDTGKREGDRWDEMFFPDISLPKAKKKN